LRQQRRRDRAGYGASRATLKEKFDVIAANLWGDREIVGLDGKTCTEKTCGAAASRPGRSLGSSSRKTAPIAKD